MSRTERLTPKEAALELGPTCSARFVLSEIKKGNLPAVRFNRKQIWITREDIRSYIEAHKVRRAI